MSSAATTTEKLWAAECCRECLGKKAAAAAAVPGVHWPAAVHFVGCCGMLACPFQRQLPRPHPASFNAPCPLSSAPTAPQPTWSMSPCVADTVWSRSRILSVSQSTLRRVLAKMTDCRTQQHTAQHGIAQHSVSQQPQLLLGQHWDAACPPAQLRPNLHNTCSPTQTKEDQERTCVMARVSYRSHRVSSFQSSFSTLT